MLQKAASIGPKTEQLARTLFARLGSPRPESALRPDQPAPHLLLCGDRSGVRPLPRSRVCLVSPPSGARSNDRLAAAPVVAPALTQEGPAIRAIAEYQSFWEEHSRTQPLEENADAHVPWLSSNAPCAACACPA